MKPRRPSEVKSAKRNGFTLIELLVAMAITSIIILALFAVVGQSTTNYTQTSRAVNTLSQARAFIQFFDREISTRLPSTPLIHETGGSGGVADADKIAFVRTLPAIEQSADSPGDLATSMYYVGFSQDLGSDVSPKLFRRTLNPEETQNEILDTTGTPSLPPTTENDEAIVYNVLDFQARPQKLSANGSLEDWSETDTDSPVALVMSIRFIDESSAQRFTDEAAWNRLASSPSESERQLLRTFTRTIPLAK